MGRLLFLCSHPVLTNHLQNPRTESTEIAGVEVTRSIRELKFLQPFRWGRDTSRVNRHEMGHICSGHYRGRLGGVVLRHSGGACGALRRLDEVHRGQVTCRRGLPASRAGSPVGRVIRSASLCAFRPAIPRSRARARRSAGGRCRCAGRSASCGRCRAGAGSWRGCRRPRSGACGRPACSRTRRSGRGLTPPLMPPPHEPVREAVRIVVAALAALRTDGMRPNSVVQRTIVSSSRPRPLQVRDERRRAAGHAGGERAVVALHVLVAVPVAPREAVVVAAPDLHEPHAALEQPPRDEALAAEVVGLLERVDLLVERRSSRGRGRRASASPSAPSRCRAPPGAASCICAASS